MFQWIKGSAYSMIATVSTNYITLNNTASSYFKDVKWCLVGIDADDKKLAIKPVSKKDIDLAIYPKESLHKISVGNGYARISNKNIMQSLADICEKPLATNTKYTASYDEKEDMLVVDLTSEED